MQIIGVVKTRALRFDTTDPVLYSQDVFVSSVELLKQTEFSSITNNLHNSMELLASSSPYDLSVCPSAWYKSTHIGRMLMKSDISDFLENRKKFKFY